MRENARYHVTFANAENARHHGAFGNA